MSDIKFHGPDADNKPIIKLLGEDGHAFSIMGRCRKTAMKAGWSKEQVEALLTDMRSGDYDHLLAVAMENFTELDEDEE